jgi:radical SAM-linked protein
MTETEINPETPIKVTAPTRALYRIRMRYAHREALRYVSNLDMHMVWERSLRRAGVPLAYSKGFSQHPRLHLAAALPLGFLSRCELADFWLEYPPETPAPDLEALKNLVQASAPPGLEIQSAELVDLSQPALQTQVQSAEYLAVPFDPMDTAVLVEAVQRLMEAESLPRERRGKPYDLRALIDALTVEADSSNRPTLRMRLAAREGATGRPEELLTALGLDPATFRVERTTLILK